MIETAFETLRVDWDLGRIHLNISGCINACGHHHVGHIGILGINKLGDEYYQVMLGGSSSDDASLGKIIGPAFPRDKIIPALRNILETYVALRRNSKEAFIHTVRRVGLEPFKEKLYGPNQASSHRKKRVA
jgi:sulfite reductase (NADPH) hemoprotein beta-component